MQLLQLWKESLKKNSGMYGIRTLDLCDTSVTLLPIELTTNWEQIVELVRYKPLKGWWSYDEVMNIWKSYSELRSELE